MKKILKIFMFVLLGIVALAALFLGWLTIREYRPEDVTPLEVRAEGGTEKITAGETISLISWNVGYCGLGKDSDFIMDGGGNAPAPDEATVRKYMAGIEAVLEREDADIYMLQEVDTDSSRSFNIDQRDVFTLGNDCHALNYSCDFVPFPWPPIGKVNSGVFTTTDYCIESADRYSLPCPFSWPLRVANLKRCLMASYLPIEGSDKKLVIVNFHLEAYDSGEGKIAQTKQLMEFVQSEYEKGNYVIAGGDWNQTYPGSLELFPNTHEELWKVGFIDVDMLPEGWLFAYDVSTPTCRLLNQPYDPADTENTQYYVIDGFIVSPNIQLDSINVINENFENSDHNPVRLEVALLPEN